MKPFSPKWRKSALAARQDDDLLILGNTVQGGEHGLDPVVVAVNQRIIKDHRHRPARMGEEPGKGQPGQDGQLFAGAA